LSERNFAFSELQNAEQRPTSRLENGRINVQIDYQDQRKLFSQLGLQDYLIKINKGKPNESIHPANVFSKRNGPAYTSLTQSLLSKTKGSSFRESITTEGDILQGQIEEAVR
jgi:hypothetical protein